MTSLTAPKLALLVVLALFVGAVAIGCAPGEEVEEPEEAEEPQEEPEEEPEEPELFDPLIFAQGIDVPHFDSADHTTSAKEAILINIYDKLVFRSAEGEVEPALATEWEVLDDRTWEFRLRDDVLWHDGEPFTAEDVEFTLMRVIEDEELDQHRNFVDLSHVEAIDDHTVHIHTHEPDPFLLNRLTGIGGGIKARHYFEEVGEETALTEPLGTGPYKFVNWVRDERIEMTAFSDHWRGAPEIENIVHRTIPEDSTRVAEAVTGGVHIATNVPVHRVDDVQESEHSRIVEWPQPRVMLFYVQCHEWSETSDPRVREAIDYAIDVSVLIEDVMGGAGVPKRGFVNFPGARDSYIYDPDRARELLEEAGYGPGELTLQLDAPQGRYPMDAELAEVMAVMLEEVGINVEMRILEWSAYIDRILTPEDAVENLAFLGLAYAHGDPTWAIYWNLSRWEDRGYVNEEVNELIGAAATTLDLDKKARLTDEAAEIVMEERPYIWLFQLENFCAVHPNLDWETRFDEGLWMFDARPK